MKSLSTAHQHPSVEYNLVVVNGPEKGTVYRLMSSQISIGRGSDCDIILAYDQKCSRKHALVTATGAGFEVTDLTDRNKIYVDGIETKRAVLHENSILALGETELRFVSRSHEVALTKAEFKLSTANIFAGTRPKTLKPKGNNTFRYVVIGVVVLFGYLLMSETKKRKAETNIRTDEQIQADIATVEALKEAALKSRPGGGQPKSQAEELAIDEAQAAYVRGFRDYRKGQYSRALESFQACLTIYPQHLLCNRYLRLSQRKHNELIQYQMVLGRRYRDQQQYSACVAAFQNVMFMVQDTNNATFKEARANFQACQAYIEERF